ncbi:uncharacterized protein JCM10292_000032 [Rhodotorula paludigena]|uniref:uncharacterized protein n=1 Tax=Rhodotorula paludigena TaxID=86838 RepID=UPI00317841E2
MSSPCTPSGTPATDRRYALSSAPPSSGPRGRFSRPMKAALALAALAALIVAIVPAAVVTTRDDDSGPEQANALGYTTTINGVETFVQTATAAVVTRQSFTTLADGQVSTVQQQLTLPVVTVSATAFDTVQAGFETVTIDGQQVIVATRTEYLAGANFVVTRTATGAAGIATIFQTVFEDVTHCVIVDPHDKLIVVG